MTRRTTSATTVLLSTILTAGVAGAQTTADPAATSAEPAEAPVKPVEGQIETQKMDTVLASQLIGAIVYAPDDETVGEIGDMIVTMEGKVEGVVIGVGGFLGMGEKDVAIQMSALQTSMTPGNDVRIVLDSTKADLEAAPAFTSVEEQRTQAQAAAARAQMDANTPAVGDAMSPVAPAAPVDPAAPADPGATSGGTTAPAQ